MKAQIPLLTKLAPRRGFALVVTLCALVVLTVLILAFFSQALLNRQIAFSSTNLAKADYLARYSMDFVTSELRQEIYDGSEVVDGGSETSPPMYWPLSKFDASPRKIGVTNPDANLGKFTIAKVSAADQPVRPNGSVKASNVSLDARSPNGRLVSRERWFGAGGPGLGSQDALPTWFFVTRGNGVKTPAIADAKSTTSGDYVIGRFGYTLYDVSGLLDANVAGFPAVADPLAGAKNSTAYATLAALDTAPGTGLTPEKIAEFITWRNGADAVSTENVFGAFLREFGLPRGFDAVRQGQNAFLTRRDLLNAEKGGLLTSKALGYLTHTSSTLNSPTWGPTLNAEDMVDYVGGPTTTAYKYKDLANDPDSHNRFIPNVRISTTLEKQTLVHYRDDGTTHDFELMDGDPLVQRRFSLAKLKWLGWNGPYTDAFSDELSTTEQAQAIASCFGLRWDSASGRWDYLQFASTPKLQIKTLAEVADEKREPNFFEMLNAGILQDSLGQHPGASPEFLIAANFDAFSGNKARHILQIGANIIDQYDEDGYPTLIYADSGGGLTEFDEVQDTISGIENLPYIHRLHRIEFCDPSTSVANDINNQTLRWWLSLELWNLHQQRKENAPGIMPTRFRARAYGAAYTRWKLHNRTTPPYSETGPKVDFDTNPIYGSEEESYRNIYFKDDTGKETSRFFNNPMVMVKDDMVTDDDNMITPPINYVSDEVDNEDFVSQTKNFRYLGIYTGETPYYRVFEYRPKLDGAGNPIAGTETNPWLAGGTFTDNELHPDPMISAVLECWDGERWRPYTSFSRFTYKWSADDPVGSPPPDLWTKYDGDLNPEGRSYGHTPDPRTDRFSLQFRRSNHWRMETSVASNGSGSQTTETNFGGDFPDHASTVFRYAPGPAMMKNQYNDYALRAVDLSINRVLTALDVTGTPLINRPYYADTDGVVRPADAIRQDVATNSSPGDGRYFYHYNHSQHKSGRVRRRAVVLDRAFQSVAEMGYAFRDLPGRNLDFWTSQSADAGLLDLFCLNDQPGMTAGKFNPNRAPKPVLEAVLSGGSKASLPTSTVVTPVLPAKEEKILPSEAATLASSVITYLEDPLNEPLANPQDLVLGLASPMIDSLPGDPATAPFKHNKAWAEAPVRALSQSTQTRSWNLMIDVVAQTGRLPRNAAGLEKFVVEGEKRYWLHLSIDRFTGQVLSRQLEPVL